MTFATAVPILFTSFVYRTNVYWSVIHGIKRKPHLSVVWNWYHFVAIAILHQPRSTDSALINDHAPLKIKYIKKRSVPYMNNRLRKSQYQRNIQIKALIVGGPRSIFHLSMLYVICWTGTKFPHWQRWRIYTHTHIYIYVFITFMSTYMNMMCISYGVLSAVHPLGLCRAEPGINRSLDARLGSVQIRVMPHLFSIYLCFNFVYIALCTILHYLSVAH